MIRAVTCLAALMISGSAHACEGRIVRIADGAEISFEGLKARASAARIVAVGERHGVKAHPRATGCLLDELARDGSPTPLVVEHISSDRQQIVDETRAAFPESPDRLGAALRWWQSGWPSWSSYSPLFTVAWRHRLPVIAGDRPRKDQASQAEVSAGFGKRTRAVTASWATSLRRARCGLGDDAELESLAMQQAGRDLHFAAILRSIDGRALFFGGRAHVRKDRGVPMLAGADASVLSVSLQETTTGEGAVNQSAALREAKGRYDYIWFIGETREESMCVRLRRLGLSP